MVAQTNAANNYAAKNIPTGRERTGHDKVDAISQLQLLGDITPRSWYKHICYTTKTGDTKVDRLAIDILSDIIYWYRAYEIRDEITSFHTGWGKKFKEDMLRRSTEDFAQSLNATARTVRESIKVLESLGLIQVVYKPLKTDFGVIPNIMYIDVFPDAIASITYPVTKNSDSTNVNAETLEKSLSTKWSISSDEMRNPLSTKSSISSDEIVGITIYRENTSENTKESVRARAQETHEEPPVNFPNAQNVSVPEVKNKQPGLDDQQGYQKLEDIVIPNNSYEQGLKKYRDTSNATRPEVQQDTNTIEVEVVDKSSSNDDGVEILHAEPIPNQDTSAPGLFNKTEQENELTPTELVLLQGIEKDGMPENSKLIKPEYRILITKLIGKEIVKLYRYSGNALTSLQSGHDVKYEFKNYLATASNKGQRIDKFHISGAQAWIIAMEKDPLRWQELRDKVAEWQASIKLNNPDINLATEISNRAKINNNRVREKFDLR